MTDEEYNWDDYYKWIQGREPRQLLLEALKKFPAGELLHAIDLGCGDGTETVVLLSHGWNGQLAHQEATINDQVVITDIWENEAMLNAFLHEFALPAFERAGLPTPGIKTS